MSVVPGTDGDDFLFGTDRHDRIVGFDPADRAADVGNDRLFGIGGADTLKGGGGDDQLAGGGGSDVLHGGQGNDALVGDSSFEPAGVDTLTGGAGNDRFEWDPFGNTSTALVTDVVTDFRGAGSAFSDTLELATFDPATRFTFGGALPSVPLLGSSIGTSGDALAAVLYAFDGGDTFVLADTNDNGTYDADDFTIRLTGQHQLVLADFGDTPIVIAGTGGADTINGTPGSDTILALGGSDTVDGRGGDDVIEGGDGKDALDGGTGVDRIEGGNRADRIDGGADRDLLTGGAGDDIIRGGAGNDSLMSGGKGTDVVDGGGGEDTLDGDDGNDTLNGGANDDTLFAGAGSDALNGGRGGDELFGDAGSDTLNGGAGDDTLEGDAGGDRLRGDGGDDEFVFFLGGFNPSSKLAAHDTIIDFHRAGAAGGDTIDLGALSQPFVFRGEISIDPIAGAALSGADNDVTEVFYTIRDGRTWLIADDNDNGVLNDGDFAVELVGRHHFTQADFSASTGFVVAGTAGDDVLSGTEDDDVIFGLSGDDRLSGLRGNDELHGGSDDDLLDGGPGGFDNLFGEEGNDELTLARSNVGGVASGGDGDDLLFGSDRSFSNFDNSLQGDAGNDDLRAGSVGSSLNGGQGSDRLVSGAADDQMEAGRDEFGFDLDNASDLFVYSGVGPWSAAGSVFGDTISGFQDGSDLFDMRGSGLQLSDLTIVNDDFQTTITSDRGTITIFESFGQEAFIDQADFLF